MKRRHSRLSGTSATIWATLLEVALAKAATPANPAYLVVTLHVVEGVAGVGWYDDSGLAEELFVPRSPRAQHISLTVWRPQECRRLIIRNVQNKRVSVELVGTEWVAIDRSTLTEKRFAIDRSVQEYFLDQAFTGRPAEILWNSWRENRFDQAKRYRALNRLVWTAWESCRGYRDFWRSQGWHPGDLRTLEDVQRIPIITKDRIRAKREDFTVSRPGLADFTTSGTTGAPFAFRYSPVLAAAHLSAVAIAASYGDRAFLPWQQRALVIRRSLRGASATGAGGSLIINASFVHDADLICRLIAAYRPTVFFGWPSYASSIAQAVRDRYRFRMALLGSENILANQVNDAAQIAGVVVGTYGLSEGTGFAVRCHTCGAYAELDTHGIISLNKRADGLFDIIGTSFWSRGTLFIGYNNGDLTFGPTTPCPSCPPGTHHFKSPTGRSQEFVVDGRGSRHALAMIVGAERLIPLLGDVELFDFVQVTPGKLVLRYVTANRMPIDEERVMAEFAKVVPEELALTCRYDQRILELRRGLPPTQKWTTLKRVDFEC